MTNMQCDFCSHQEEKYHTEQADDVSIFMEGSEARSQSGWLSCAECHRLIEQGNRASLMDRSIVNLVKKHGNLDPKLAREAIKTIHAAFWKARK